MRSGVLRRFRHVQGAIDIASVLAGVVILGIVTSIAAASLAVVIPWVNDQAAAKDLSSLTVSESSARAGAAQFVPVDQLAPYGYHPSTGTAKIAFGPGNQCYVAVIQSQTGKLLYVTSRNISVRSVDPTGDAPDLSTECSGATFPGPVGMTTAVKLAFSASTQFDLTGTSQQFAPTTSGGNGSFTYSVSGTLPTGVSFDSASGTFTGAARWNASAKQVAVGGAFGCLLTVAGGVRCWGQNTSGQLGDGTTTNRKAPVDVTGLTSGVAAISAGSNTACALMVGGGVKCWGDGTNGTLGNGGSVNSSVPVDVTGLTAGVSSISVGTAFACAVTTAGGAKCWGYNGNGQIGNNTVVTATTPVDVSTLTSGVSAVSAGMTHACALQTTGAAKCWGAGTLGQLGNNTSVDSKVPVQPTGLTTGVVFIQAGYKQTCASTTGGVVQCWGQNNYGALFTSKGGANILVPTTVPELASATAFALGQMADCANFANSTPKCWGQNNGTFGNGTGAGTVNNTPTATTGITDASYITQNGQVACAVVTNAVVKCWGQNVAGEVGNGTTTAQYSPVVTSSTGQNPGFPATVTVTVKDTSGKPSKAATATVALTLG